MSVLTVMQFIVNIIIMIVLLTIMILGVIWLFKDKGQNQHSVLRIFLFWVESVIFLKKSVPN